MRRLSGQQRELLQKVLSKRAPEWLVRLDEIEVGTLSAEDILKIMDVLADELMDAGMASRGELSAYGLQLDELIGWFSLQLP